jgi:hypothetical protein
MDPLPFGNYGFSIAVYVIGIMLSVAGISLGMGYAINKRSLKEFGKEEIYQSIINGVLVGSMLLLFSQGGIVNSMINQITLYNSTSISCQAYMSNNAALCLAYDYLAGSGYTYMGTFHPSILSSTTTLMAELLGLNTILGVIGSININLVVVSISLGSVVNPITSQIMYFVRILTTISMGALVQSSILIFVSLTATTIILPAGLILRSFYPTRKVGGFLIALSIGLYIVLPLSYVMDAMIANSYYTTLSNSSIVSLTSSANSFKGTLTGIPQVKNASDYGSAISFLGTITNGISSISNYFSGIINWLISTVAYFIVYTFILPGFSLIITIISVRELSAMLGSEAFFDLFRVM